MLDSARTQNGKMVPGPALMLGTQTRAAVTVLGGLVFRKWKLGAIFRASLNVKR